MHSTTEANRESVYRSMLDALQQLPTTKQRELQWAEVRPDPPKHINLALNPRPTHFGRLCRFRVGDEVRVCHRVGPRVIASVECPTVEPVGWSHCKGDDAIYTLDDGSRVGDVELSFATLFEFRRSLPSGRYVRAISHNGRLISLVDDDHKPLDAGDLTLEDWHDLFTFVSTKT